MATDFDIFLRNLAETISSHSTLEIENANVEASTADTVAERRRFAEEAMELQWGERLDTLASIPGRVHISWRSDAPVTGTCTGEICIRNPFDAFRHHPFDMAIAEKTPDALDKSVFDDHPVTGDGCLTLLSITDELDDFRLYYLNRNVVIPLDLSIEQYLEWLKVTKGYIHWPLLFSAADFRKKSPESHAYFVEMADHLETLFPGENYSDLRDRINALQP